MDYRKLEIDSRIDKETEIILEKLARWHSLTPKNWREDYRISNKDIRNVIDEIKRYNKEDLIIILAEDKLGELRGFIWACKDKDIVNIMSLYVEKAFRKRGIAKELKRLLEIWSRENNIKLIKTTVHYKNKDMLRLNEKLGYNYGMVSMSKTLKQNKFDY